MYPWYKVTQPGATVNWFRHRSQAEGFAERTGGVLEGQTWDDYAALFPALTNSCAVCEGELIGSELQYGTCGHCGGRSL